MNTDLKVTLAVIVLMAVGVFIWLGPEGCSNSCNAWKASSYGSDWLVVQYAQSGCVITSWDLKDAAVHNEGSSDGIYFQHEGSTVHLSGHYVYVEKASKDLRRKLLAVGKCNPPEEE